MNMIDIIQKKRKGKVLSKEEITYAVTEYVGGAIPDYQMSALLMAICINGMEENEIYALTDCMLESGERISLEDIPGIKVDKHSTGGVGDKITLVVAPLVASCGVSVAKMSGRALGFTGGTIDKLESIPGFQTEITMEEFLDQVKNIGIAVVGQTGDLVPADKKIYALRDASGTVDSLPLIASSIMSKKLASGADKIVIDLKVGDGALLKTLEEAKELAKIMVKIGRRYQKETICILTSMAEPLGYAIGNSLEVLESIDVLKGRGPADVREVACTLASRMVALAKEISLEEAQSEVTENLQNGKALSKWEEFVRYQKGDPEGLTVAPKEISIKSSQTGFIQKIHTEQLGEVVRKIGGGRFSKEDNIDYGVGIVLEKKVGDYVLENESLLKVYFHEKDISLEEILSCFEIGMKTPPIIPLIYGIVH